MTTAHLPPPGSSYNEDQQRSIHEVLEIELNSRISRFEDIEVAPPTTAGSRGFEGNRIVLTSPDGTRFELVVDDAGVLGTNPL